ncbi:hypothetical protein J3459_010456 [Metarhizium acridum]|nr:hypothetical protein J3459_010456 [Metarhizium acridum]
MAKWERYGYHDVDVVIKREDASPGRDIKYEAMIQRGIYGAARSLQLTSVPQVFHLIDQEDDKRWHDLLPVLPAGLGKCRTMIAERITSVSRQAQLLLVEKYNRTPTRDRYIQALSNGRYAPLPSSPLSWPETNL